MPIPEFSNEWKLDKQGHYLYFDGEFEKAEEDACQYRLIKLVDNDLMAFLIHDEQTDTCSAAMDINVGSIHDPAELPGLAHFIEHLVFMGTEEYPGENEFDTFLSACSGYSNASTEADTTNYYFEAAHDHLKGALDRFAQLFINPLFYEESVSKEVQAVDSEYKKQKQKDGWRFSQLLKSLCNPDHPYCQFDIGSAETLQTVPKKTGKNVREEAVKFFKTYYSANIMKLCVLAREPLDLLSELVVERFRALPNKHVEMPTFEDCHPLGPNQLKKQIFVKPVDDAYPLQLFFPFPDQRTVNTVKPAKYICHLLNHEGPKSMQSLLRKKGWANYISASVDNVGPTHNIMSIYIDLTETGIEHYKDVMGIFFKYIEVMKQRGPQEQIFNDIQSASSLLFRYQDKGSSASTVTYLSKLMKFKYPPHRIMSGPLIALKYDPDLIQKHLGSVRPDNFTFMLACTNPPDSIEFTQCERWFGSEYNILDFDESLIEYLNNLEEDDELDIPRPNSFIPKNFETFKKEVAEPSKRPDLVVDSSFLRLWHKKDDTFWRPRANIWLMIRTPLAYSSAVNNNKARLYTELVDDALQELTYDARQIGFYYSIENHPEGITVFVGGYNEKLPLLLREVLQHMRNLQVDPERLDLSKNKLRQSYKNSLLDEPQEIASSYMTYMTDNLMWTKEEKLKVLDDITAEDMQTFYPLLLAEVHIESLVHGNIARDDAIKMLHEAIDTLSPEKSIPIDQLPREQGLLLPKGARWIYQRDAFDPENVNSAVDYLIQVCEDTDIVLRNKLKLLRQVIQERFFNQLRTKEKLGYSVACYYFHENGSMGLNFCVQGEHDSNFLESRIDAFIQTISEFLRDMDEETYNSHVQSIISKRKEKPNNIGEEGSSYWNQIISGSYDFNYASVDIEQLPLITKDDLIAFVNEFIDLNSPTLRKVSVHVRSQKKKNESNVDEATETGIRQLFTEQYQATTTLVDQLVTSVSNMFGGFTTKVSTEEHITTKDVILTYPNKYITSYEEYRSTLTVKPIATPVITMELVGSN